jgi:iron complex transport system substrate-binding protein
MAARRPFSHTLAAAVMGMLIVPAVAVADDPPPRRIVSSNLCADRLVLQLADRETVLSVSRFAADPAASTVAKEVTDIPVNRGDVEDIVAYHPDLVVLGSFNGRATAAMLRSLGIKVHVVLSAESIEAVHAVIRELATVLGKREQGDRMIAGMDARLAALPRHARPIKAAVYQAGGWSAGRDTMADDLFGKIGMVNIAAEAGIVGFGTLPLETLIAASPDLIVFESMGEGAPSISAELLHHPALTHAGVRSVSVPMRLWACPDPALVEAAALISGAAP